MAKFANGKPKAEIRKMHINEDRGTFYIWVERRNPVTGKKTSGRLFGKGVTFDTADDALTEFCTWRLNN